MICFDNMKVNNFPLRKCNCDIHELKYDTIFLLNWPNVFDHFICLGKLFQILGQSEHVKLIVIFISSIVGDGL